MSDINRQRLIPVLQRFPCLTQHHVCRVQASQIHWIVIPVKPVMKIIQPAFQAGYGTQYICCVGALIQKIFGAVQTERIGFNLIHHIGNRSILDLCFPEDGIGEVAV